MKIESRATRPAPSDDNLIPMINVVFLLLVFFMIAGTIRPPDPLPLDLPVTSSGAPTVTTPVLYVSATGDMMLTGEPVTSSRLPTELSRFRDGAIDTNARDTGATPSPAGKNVGNSPDLLVIKADADTPMIILRDILTVARDAGLTQVELMTSPPSAGS